MATNDAALSRVATVVEEQLAKQHRTQQVVKRAKELAASIEVEIAAQEDIRHFWLPKILRAMEKGHCSVTNFWSLDRRADDEYLIALRKLLGEELIARKYYTKLPFNRWLEYLAVEWE